MSRSREWELPSSRHPVVTFAVLVALAVLASWIGSAVYLKTNGYTTVKPFCGCAFAFCLLYGRRILPGILVAGTLGGMIAKWYYGMTVPHIIVLPVLASLTVWGTYTISQQAIGPAIDFRVWRKLLSFIVISSAVSAVSALIFAFHVRTNGDTFIANFQAWWIPTSLSFAIFTPVCLLLRSSHRSMIRQEPLRALLCFSLILATLTVNLLSIDVPQLFFIQLALVVTAFVCEVEGAAIGLLLTEVFLTTSTVYGHGIPALTKHSVGEQLYLTQVFVGLLILVILPIASAVSERRRLHESATEALAKLAESTTALHLSEQRYRLLADNVSDVMLQADAEGQIEYVSPSVTGLVGYSPEEMVGTLSETNIVEEDKQRVRDLKADLRQKGQSRGVIIYRVRHKDGSTRWVENRLTLLSDQADAPAGMVGVIRDVSEREAIKSELILARESAEAANYAKSEFLANMSHELRTPLTSVIGFADLLHDHGNLEGPAKGYADRVRNGGRSLLATINDVLDYSKIEGGNMPIAPGATQFVEVVRSITDLLEVQAKTSGLELHLRYSASLSKEWLLLDEQRVRQILLNLVGNAIKFTSAGSVIVSITSVEGMVHRVRCEITDTGVGIPADQTDKLFQRFSQVDSSASKGFGGTGLGLAICKGLVEAMGGEIGVSSVLGEGSTFWFEIPAPRTEAEAAFPVPFSTVTPTDRKQVLVVDDNEANRAFVRAALAGCAVDVTEADCGEKAVELASRVRFDLVLMDIRMPGLGGRAAMRALREIDPAAPCPIIAFTGDGDVETKEGLTAEGFVAILTKPLTLAELRASVSTHTSGFTPDEMRARHVA